MATVIDFSASFPSGAAIRQAGHVGVVAYISPGRASWMGAKPLTRAALDDYRNHGLGVAVVWQYGAGTATASDVMRGRAGGLADARAAQTKLDELGLGGHPVFFAVDFDATLGQWNSTIVNYFKAAGEVLGKNRVGIYGHSRVIAWAQEDRVVAEVAPGRVLGWQTRSWSGGVTADRYAVLYQRVHNTPGPDGVQIDINDIWHDQWGHKPSGNPPREDSGMTLEGRQFPTDIDIYTQAHSGGRDPNACQFGCIHTTENSDSTPPDNVAKWQQNTANDSSYNVLVGTDGRTVRSNDDNIVPWSAGQPGNRIGLHISAIGHAARNRDHWHRFPEQLESLARWCADLHLRYEMPLVWLSPSDLRAGRRGFTSHENVYRGLGGPAYRSDPGAGFPHQYVLDRAEQLTQGGGITVSEADRIIKFIEAYLGPNNSDTKDIRQQLTGGRDSIPGDPVASYPGWPGLGQNSEGNDLTVTDAIAALRRDVADIGKRIDRMEGKR